MTKNLALFLNIILLCFSYDEETSLLEAEKWEGRGVCLFGLI